MPVTTKSDESEPFIAIDLILGVVLMAAPWILGYSADRVAMTCSLVGGAFIACCTISALGGLPKLFGEVDIALGALIAIAPWLLGFAHDHKATTAQLALGLLVALVSAAELRQLRSRPTS